jgi:hypothetical protein
MADISRENRTVKLQFPAQSDRLVSKSDGDTFLSMIEHILSCHYQDYEIILQRDRWDQRLAVEIIFKDEHDAAWFKLTHMKF